MSQPFAPHDALIVVDVQRDFCPGGALPIPDGHAVVPVINRWIGAADLAGVPVFFSRDWHPRGHMSFREQGGPWPEHCVQDTEGAGFHPDLRPSSVTRIVTKGDRTDRDQYSAFDGTGLGAELGRARVRRVWLAGLAEDVCVRATVLDALAQGFEVRLIGAGTRPVTAEGGQVARQQMREAGVVVELGTGP
jgi:nicotinamidase/pyrazinamidase